MNGNKVFVDTNILIYLLKGDKDILNILNGKLLLMSFITELELLSFPKLDKKTEKLIRELIANCKILGYNDDIKDLTLSFRKKYSLKLPDAIIAATGYYLQAPLLTSDKIFHKIDEMEIIIYEV